MLVRKLEREFVHLQYNHVYNQVNNFSANLGYHVTANCQLCSTRITDKWGEYKPWLTLKGIVRVVSHCKANPGRGCVINMSYG